MIVVQIAGRLGKDAETRFTSSGQKVTTLTMAANTRKAGKDETVWWRVTIWGDRFDKMMPYFKKGSALVVIGDMHKPEIWTDKEGRQQVSMDMTADIIRFNPFGGSAERSPQDAPAANQASPMASNYAASHPGYAANQANASYGANNGDFGGVMQGAGAHYAPAEAEEDMPF